MTADLPKNLQFNLGLGASTDATFYGEAEDVLPSLDSKQPIDQKEGTKKQKHVQPQQVKGGNWQSVYPTS